MRTVSVPLNLYGWQIYKYTNTNSSNIVYSYYSTNALKAGKEMLYHQSTAYRPAYTETYIYRGIIKPDNAGISPTAVITKITLTKFNSVANPVQVRVNTSDIPGSGSTESEKWTMTGSGTLVGTLPAYTTETITITDAAQIANVLAYGLTVMAPDDAIYSHWLIFRCGNDGDRLTYEYYDEHEAPVIALTEPADLTNHLTTDTLTLSWTYAQDADVPQASYTIQASYDDGATWETAASETSAAHTHTFPADTFHTGTLRLRVIASSAYADSDPAEVRVLMRANPATSDVSCDGNPHPTVSWTGADQTAYQVRFGDWDSGTKYGSASSMTIPRIFAAGVYPVTVRTQTSNGDWSAWSDTLWVEITNSAPECAAVLTVQQTGASALCSWTGAANAVGYILMRDGEPVYAGQQLYYRDDEISGPAVYTVRCVYDTGYYTDSEPVTLPYTQRCDVLRPLDDDTADWIAIRYSLDRRSRSYDRQLGTSFRYYAGREKPVAISTGESTRTMRTTAAFKTRAQAEAILALAGRPVIYKDVTGGVIIGILNPAGYDSERVFSVDLSITEIDHAMDTAGYDAMTKSGATRKTEQQSTEKADAAYGLIGTSEMKWISSSASRYWTYAVPSWADSIRVVTTYNNELVFLRNGTFAAGEPADCCQGHGKIIYMQSRTRVLALPSDCTCVYLRARLGTGWANVGVEVYFEGQNDV